ncbi:MAG: hypothetical protein QNJ40_10850 [Xanthomonadales bacterium]|nr:hypothetical protein [Xanthomonadales bacterium]
MSFYEQLKRRNVFRVTAAYIAFSWLIVQVIETLFPVFEIGPGVIRVIVIVLAIGLVPVVLFSWLFEWTSEGIQRDAEVDPDSGPSLRSRQRLNQLVVVSLTLAVSYFAVDKFVLSGDAGSSTNSEHSIAVMPFINLSDNDDMTFFSDGVAEDILGRLTRTQGLRCIARSSSFLLRDQELAPSDIASRLGVTHLLTGSLRSHQGMIRMSVRLVEAQSDTQVWSHNYDRRLDDVFAIQDEISREVVAAIAPKLLAGLPHTPVPPQAEVYVDYLRARERYLIGRNSSDVDLIRSAMDMFEAVVRRSPGYAPPYAGLADAWGALAIEGEADKTEAYEKARRYAQQALAIDDALPEAWFALGDIQIEFDWDLPAANHSYQRALALAPQDAEGIRSYAYFLSMAGQFNEADKTYRRALALDPISNRAYAGLYMNIVRSGRFDAAEEFLTTEISAWVPQEVSNAIRRTTLAAARDFERLAELLPVNAVSLFDHIHTAMVHRWRGENDLAEQSITRAMAVDPGSLPKKRMVAAYYAAFGDFDRALALLQEAVDDREVLMVEVLYMPSMKELREDSRFWELVERAGIKPLPISSTAPQ